jgi:hypothetical protein
MKAQLLPRWALATGLLLLGSACSESLSNVNNDPNAPTDVDAQFVLPQAIRSAVENTFNAFPMLSHTGIWSQQLVELQYPDEEQGHVRPENIQGFWDSYYAGPLTDIQAVIDKGVATASPNVEAVGLIWKTWIFHLVTDLWGDVPYSEALKAKEGITTPAYDSQQAIYAAMIQSLKDAVAKLDPAAPDFGSGDILYGNDFGKWGRFANSLRMRLAMRLQAVDPATAQTEFVSAYNAGGFTSNDDNAMLEWPGAPYQNPFYENWTGRDDHGISAAMVDTLTSLNDPRLQLYAEPHQYPAAAPDGRYVGLGNNIATPDSSLAYYSRIGNFWRRDGAASPTAIMTYSEVLFLEAEAAERGWIAGSAATLYEDAIRANMAQYAPWAPANEPTQGEIDAYVVQANVVYVPGATGLAQIQLQKWISLFMNGHEAWANQRRTDLPVLTAGPDLDLTRLPVRYFYPAGEQSLNAANLAAAMANQGGKGGDLVGTVWWDIN